MAIPVKETKEKIVVCAVCGAKLELNKLYHYIARDDGFTGAVTVFTKEQEKPMYDAFDCPVCGCQYIAQERKRTLFDVVCSDEPGDDDTETSDNTEETSDKEEKPECKGCEYDDDPQNNPFSMMCVSCRRMYTDKDLFGGSGSTLIACEQLNRKCYMCELDTHYCDVIIQRWENFTGQKAVLIDG